ncbi:MAG: hypothetical protein OEZ01_05775, partial [Candidatus Heimdallarchaeota archaeon]|nr:hypothetical protein [Candidatus Heimdallarchaeota archaeon]
ISFILVEIFYIIGIYSLFFIKPPYHNLIFAASLIIIFQSIILLVQGGQYWYASSLIPALILYLGLRFPIKNEKALKLKDRS